jgi:N-acetylglutamate synthase-like GNAT family acetyltransferase/protein-tyrosine-phosphatase
MTTQSEIQKATSADEAAIKQLLQQNKLPTEDINDLSHFFIVKEDKKIIGTIGLEVYGDSGLLRSMATDAAYRNRGIAASLVAVLFQHARELGLKEIYLLTETAEKYFEKKGFHKIERNIVPEAVKQSKEFSHLCASTAIAMKKEVTMKKKVLFVCIENSNRSQISQAFAKMLAGENIEAYSAGSKPSGIVNPKAIAAMKELGYDLNKHDSKSLQDVKRFAPFDAVVTMGCGDACPWMPAKKFINWEIPDPKHMEPGEFNKVRDYIKEKVKELLQTV